VLRCSRNKSDDFGTIQVRQGVGWRRVAADRGWGGRSCNALPVEGFKIREKAF
jgi:hypothetical protein